MANWAKQQTACSRCWRPLMPASPACSVSATVECRVSGLEQADLLKQNAELIKQVEALKAANADPEVEALKAKL